MRDHGKVGAGMYRVTLTFVVEDESEAWQVSDRLEQAAMKQGTYREVNSWVAPVDGRIGALGPEGHPVTSSAETLERVAGRPSMFGFEGEAISLGDENGRMG